MRYGVLLADGCVVLDKPTFLQMQGSIKNSVLIMPDKINERDQANTQICIVVPNTKYLPGRVTIQPQGRQSYFAKSIYYVDNELDIKPLCSLCSNCMVCTAEGFTRCPIGFPDLTKIVSDFDKQYCDFSSLDFVDPKDAGLGSGWYGLQTASLEETQVQRNQKHKKERAKLSQARSKYKKTVCSKCVAQCYRVRTQPDRPITKDIFSKVCETMVQSAFGSIERFEDMNRFTRFIDENETDKNVHVILRAISAMYPTTKAHTIYIVPRNRFELQFVIFYEYGHGFTFYADYEKVKKVLVPQTVTESRYEQVGTWVLRSVNGVPSEYNTRANASKSVEQLLHSRSSTQMRGTYQVFPGIESIRAGHVHSVMDDRELLSLTATRIPSVIPNSFIGFNTRAKSNSDESISKTRHLVCETAWNAEDEMLEKIETLKNTEST